jgi:acetylornithine deacetylase/succinyl-diaminopimelate desuccinylase-like protein
LCEPRRNRSRAYLTPRRSAAPVHKPDEFVELSELMNCAGFIERLIAHCSEHRDLTVSEKSF